MILLAGSLSLREIVDAQAGYWFGFIPKWYLFLQPVGFIIYMMRRRRRDQPRAVRLSRGRAGAGRRVSHRVQLGALRAVLPQAEYINMVTMSAVATDLYLGGWHGPFLPDWLGWIWFLVKVFAAAVLLHLDALDAAALPLRPADGVRLEVAVPGGGAQPARDGGAGAVIG